VHLIPANATLAMTEKHLITKMSRERTLARALAPLASAYDYVFLDCPPALDLLNTNGLAAADEVLIPLQSSTLALLALPDFLRTVDAVRREINPHLHVGRIVLTMHQGHTGHSHDVLQAVLAQFPGQVSQTTVPLSVAAKDSAASGTSIFTYDPTSGVAEAYRRLAEELIAHA
jgi:chromosome partitioning protein